MVDGPSPPVAGPSQPKIAETVPQPVPVSPISHVYPHPPLPTAHTSAFPYYGHPPWQGQPWPSNGYPYNPAYQQQYPQMQPYQPAHFQQYQPPTQVSAPARSSAHSAPQRPSAKRKARLRTPSPSPPPKEFPRHWDSALKAFFVAVGLSQCLAGLEADILVMNPDWERKVVPDALSDLQSSISRLLEAQPDSTSPHERPLDERKLDYVRVEKGAEARSPVAINKSISDLLGRNRARNDASNRAEFLHTFRRLRNGEASEVPPAGEPDDLDSGSCARADAKTVDRDVMMKFDIAKNEEGPLRRTLKVEMKDGNNRPTDEGKTSEVNLATANRHPGLDERLNNLETHLAMRYVPSPPASLLHRIKFVEDHIIQLEREYPPWAALHFNQPRRGWPPPPRPTPVIVPSHLTSNPAHNPPPAPSDAVESSLSSAPTTYSGKAVTEVRTKGRASRSSLHRAVLEKLEVQRAIEDLNGEGEPG